MSAELSNDFKETVRAQTNIVTLIGEYLQIQPVHGGREYVGLCPFHNDTNPSLRVYPDRQSYRCWSCNAGGDCFSFVMEKESVEFREALEILANRARVPIPKTKGRPTPPGQEKTKLLEALLWAEGLFHSTLRNDESARSAREYLDQRGFTAETIERFKLGYHPNDWEWLLRRAQGKFSPEQLTAAGLCNRRDGSNGYFDYFVDRVMFPIHNERGQPVGFGGRVLPGADDSFGKYFNSNENPVFHKSRLVYALDHAREGLKQSETAVVTEGYTDCITAHQAGVSNVVATLGTALTEMQVTTIRRFARRVVLVYDGDQAGQNAAARAVGRFLAQDVDLRILTLPDGQDPADYISEHGPEAFQQKVHHAPEAFDYMFDVLKGRFGLDSLDSRQRILEGVLGVLAGVPKLARNVREDLLLRRVSQRLGIAEDVVRKQYSEARQGTVRRPQQTSSSTSEHKETAEYITRILRGQPTPTERIEYELAQILISVPRLAEAARQECGAGEITNPALRTIIQTYYDFVEEGIEEQTFSRLLATLDSDQNIKRLAVWLDEQARIKNLEYKLCQDAERGDEDCPHILRRTLDQLKRRRDEESHHRAALELSQAGDGAHGLDEAAERQLRRLSEFHQKRATMRPKSA